MISLRSISLAWVSLFALLIAPVVAENARVSCERRTLVVTISDKAGPVMNLSAANVRLESKPPGVEVSSFSPPHHPPRAMLLLDLSESMRKPGELKVISSLARGFIDAAPVDAPIALITFSDSVNDRVGFPAPKQTILQRIEAIKQGALDSKGAHTALIDALDEAIPMFDSPRPGDVILLISDGIDNRSRAQLRDVKRQLLECGLRLFSFVPTEEDPILDDANSGPDSLVSLSRDTGGRSFTLAPDPRMWGWDASKNTLGKDSEIGKYMYVLASSGYELTIRANQAIERPVRLTLKIVGTDGEMMQDVQSLYPQELTECTKPPQN